MSTNQSMTLSDAKEIMGIPDQKAYAMEVIPSDVLIPRLLLMQGLSEFVKNRQAQLGDIVKSTTLDAVGGPDKDLTFIPLSFKNSWALGVKPPGASRYKFAGIEKRTAENSDLPWDYFVNADGREVSSNSPGAMAAKRTKSIEVFALLPTDVDAEAAEKSKAAKGEFPDLTKALTPVQIVFRSTSFNAGQKVVTFFTQARSMKADPSNYQLTLGCFSKENDQGGFYCFDVKGTPKAASPEHAKVAKLWASILNSTSVRVDEGDSDVV